MHKNPNATPALRCDCGKVVIDIANLSRSSATRVVCCCGSCQNYLRALDHGHVLDGNGGTDLFQVSPRALTVRQGQEHIACLTMSSKGPLRWFTDCCHTPLANTLRSPGVFMTLSTYAARFPGEDPAAFIGDVRATVNVPKETQKAEGDGSGEAPRRASRWALISMLARQSPRLLGWRLRGDHRNSPWFDAEGRPLREPIRPEALASDAAG